MSKPNIYASMGKDNVEEIYPVQDFLSKFFLYMVNETGLTKQTFTRLGLQNYVKNIAKKCYQLKLWDDLLSTVIKIAALFCKSVKGELEVEGAIHEFVMILNKVVNFLAKYYLGVGLLLITATMGEGMAAFLCFLYYFAMFAIEYFSVTCFLKIKDWILMLFKSKNVTRFFEEIFPTYGKTLTMA